EPQARADEAWRRARKSHAPYTMHDADPLQPVADAWAGSFAGEARGGLEVRVAETIARWRADSIGLPDYYLVLEPDDLPAGRRDWYLGVLHRAAPYRVVPVAADRGAVLTAIGRLEAGRWWPDVPELLAGVDRLLPDRLMTSADREDRGGDRVDSGAEPIGPDS
ncbi:MAG: hypothetical protein OEV40_16300, partial [Acidimicrobiia bacterium]|nr:hypothetical protein [Acidimicrobiia bacterium]